MRRCSDKSHKKGRSKAYGRRLGLSWCGGCDADVVNEVPNPKRARRDGKKEIESFWKSG